LLILVLIAGNNVLTVSAAVISVIAMWEFYRAIGLTAKNTPLCVLGIIGSCLIIGVWLIASEYFMLAAFVYAMSLLVVMLFSRKHVTMTDVAMIIMGNIYVSYLLLHIVLVRNMLDFGELFVWLIFVGAFMTDTFAYFVGIFFGKRKLCPDISPKKTIVGAIGGVIGCGLCFVLYGFIVQYLRPEIGISVPLMFLFGLLCSVAAQIGDLVASTIKRQYDIKDFGKLLPGHGGILDRFDSILFVAPVVYLFLYHIGVII